MFSSYSEVSFSQYYVSDSVGKPVTIECKTNTLSSDIDKMAVYKTFNGTNETIAVYSNGNTNSSSDLIATFLDGVLTLTLSSLKCNDEGLYICVVTTGNSEVSSPLFLTLQPTGICKPCYFIAKNDTYTIVLDRMGYLYKSLLIELLNQKKSYLSKPK